MSSEIQETARLLEDARANNYQIQPLSNSMPNLDQKQGYEIAAAVRAHRESKNGDVVVGRKIGFSNRNIWPEYNIDASNWSYVYNNTIVDLTQSAQEVQDHSIDVDIRRLSSLEPRIEPEIVLGISSPISPSMNDLEILNGIEWIAHGFEIVASVFPNWKFTAADTTAAFALHGMLLTGPKVAIRNLAQEGVEDLLERLSSFTISLYKNGDLADEGKGSNVLGSPVKALRHLAELLEEDALNDALAPGEVVTTGTLTKALPIGHDDVWSTSLAGIDLPGLRVRFKRH